jgi:uncharacterized protein
MKATKAQIDEFLSQPHIAMAGYSRNPRKFGGSVYQILTEKGLNIIPVNPAGGTAPDGKVVYESIESLPEEVKAVLVITKPEKSIEVVNHAIGKGFTHFWVQQMSESPQVHDLLKEAPVKITNQCIILHANPKGFHKIHWWLAKTFGMLPK